MPYMEEYHEITPAERDAIIKAIVDKVERWNLFTPAIFFLQMSKPISFLGSQAMYFFAPVGGIFVEERKIENWAQIFEDRENLELLIEALEDRAEQVMEQKKARKRK